MNKTIHANRFSFSKFSLDLLNDILDFSKIEAGKLELEIQKTDIFDLISQAADVINVKANSKGIEILLNIPLSLPKIYLD